MVKGKNGSELFDVEFAPEKGDDDVEWKLMPTSSDPRAPWLLELDRHVKGDRHRLRGAYPDSEGAESPRSRCHEHRIQL